jgi:hypothetical protein
MKTTLFSSTQGDIACDLAFKNNWAGLAAPTVNDDSGNGYQVGSQWVYAGNTYSCVDATPGAAVWNLLGQNDITNPIAGIAAGYKIARGTHTQVAASDTIATGLATVVAVVASFKSGPTVKQLFLHADVGNQSGAPAAGSFLLNTYKPTAVNDVTPIAATDFTDNVKIDWIAIGT